MLSALDVYQQIQEDNFMDQLLTVIYWFVGMLSPPP